MIRVQLDLAVNCTVKYAKKTCKLILAEISGANVGTGGKNGDLGEISGRKSI